MHDKFDLKGSTYKRFASKAERTKPNPTKKDLDFNEEYKGGVFFEAETYDTLMNIIERDCLVIWPHDNHQSKFRCSKALKSWIIRC